MLVAGPRAEAAVEAARGVVRGRSASSWVVDVVALDAEVDQRHVGPREAVAERVGVRPGPRWRSARRRCYVPLLAKSKLWSSAVPLIWWPSAGRTLNLARPEVQLVAGVAARGCRRRRGRCRCCGRRTGRTRPPPCRCAGAERRDRVHEAAGRWCRSPDFCTAAGRLVGQQDVVDAERVRNATTPPIAPEP